MDNSHANFRGDRWCKTAPKHNETTLTAWNESRNAKLGTWNGLQLYKACIIWTWSMTTEARQPWDKHFYSLWHGQTASKDGAKMAYKNGPKHGIMKQVVDAKPKQKNTLLQHWRGTQNMHIYRTVKAPKLNMGRAKLLCKKWAKRWPKKQVCKTFIKQPQTLKKTRQAGQNMAGFRSDQSPKTATSVAAKSCKNVTQKRI